VTAAALLMAGAATAGEGPGARVVVVYNATEPESQKLAEYYAEKRGVPAAQICGLKTRNAETITRREFDEQIREPLWKFLVERGLVMELGGRALECRVDYLVLIYGMPLRIDPDPSLKENAPELVRGAGPRNEAAVDSELTALPAGEVRRSGWLMNPYFRARSTRFVPPLNNTLLLVGRIDGPSAAVARGLIDDAVATERYGLLGRCYFDARNIQEAGYVMGDQWMKEAHQQFLAAGFESELDEAPELFAEDFPMTDVAVYAGWYTGGVTGPFRRPDFRFRRGAIAYHIHSSSAVTVRSTSAYWTGPLLAKGAAVSFGNVFEPYLSFSPHVNVFFQRLLDGARYGEAAWYSQPGLSWQTTFVGDPLYRPFALPVEEQIARLEADRHPDLAWGYLRQVNLLMARGATNDAVALCREKAAALASVVLAEKLGDLLAGRERTTAYAAALAQATETARYFRIAMKLAAAFVTDGRPEQALAVYDGLAAAVPNGPTARQMLQRARNLAQEIGATDRAAAFQQKLDAALAAEAAPKK
jgi:uncharacterized protein (TIGR03790 family)